MIDRTETKRKKTPADVSEFERQQLQFFLSGDDLPALLADINPSLAWLPVLSQMKLIQSERQLIPWIERNFADADAVRDVAANTHFFGSDAANFLDYRLRQQASHLPQILVKSWELIIRHMRTAKRGLIDEWFEIAPRIKKGDISEPVQERLANALRPKLKIDKRLSWGGSQEKMPTRPSDLMSIEYEVGQGISSHEVLSAWPADTRAQIDHNFLVRLIGELRAALADAIDAGVETTKGYSISDTDVPSVADHKQNEYRSGFQVIVRVTAEIWTRLTTKSPQMARALVEDWRGSPFRLIRRLALYAGTNSVISADDAADMLIEFPNGELYLTNATVEVYSLIRKRWREFSKEKQGAILRHLCEGPPRDWFHGSAEIDRTIDRCRFDILSDMQREGFDVGAEATLLLQEIAKRWPKWRSRPPEQGGFHVWGGSEPREIVDDSSKLQGVADDQLVTEARKIAAAADFMAGDAWQGLSLTDPDRALRGLDAAAAKNDWPVSYWQQLLWVRKAYAQASTEQRVAQLLVQMPAQEFGPISDAASSWLNEHAKTLDLKLLWPLWDRIAEATLIDTAEVQDE